MNRTGTRVAATLMAGLAFACTEPGGAPLAPDTGFAPAAEVSPGVYVLNTQLRGIIDPDIEPSPAWGHLQLKLTDDSDGFFSVAWKGKLFNPAGQIFSSGGIIDPDIREILDLFDDSAPSCEVMILDSDGAGAQRIRADVAMGLIINPDIHEVVLVSTDERDVAGRFGLPDPTVVLGWNPQPDPPGKKVTCEAASSL